MIDLHDADLTLVPGPLGDPPTGGAEAVDVVSYTPSVFAAAVLSHAGTREIPPEDGDWWDWLALWRGGEAVENPGGDSGGDSGGGSGGERSIVVGMTLCEGDPIGWGGSSLSGSCCAGDVLALWETVRVKCPGVWLRTSGGEWLTPAGFLERYGC